MKRCPQCNRVETDDALVFCRADGTALVSHSSPPGSEIGTARFGSSPTAGESETSILSPTTDAAMSRGTAPTTVLPAQQAPGATRELTKSKRRLILVGGILLIAAVAASLGLYKLLNRSRPGKAISFASAKLQRLTTTGKATGVAISPDGKLVVHVQNEGAQRSLWVRQTATQSNVQIVAPAAVNYNSLTFSPDGDYIYYNLYSQEFPQNALFQVSTLGGAPKKILENLDIDTISFSPDGSRFAFLHLERGKEGALMIANADGTGERKLVSHKNPPEGIANPAWSPDGEKIVYAVLNSNSNDVMLYEARVADGSTKALTSQKWFRISALAWLSDGSGLLMLATPQQQFIRQIWQVSYPTGEAHQLTNDLNDYNAMSLTADSKALAVVKSERQSNVWIAAAGDASRARPVTSGVGTVGLELASSPDGSRIVYSSSASGDQDIWVINADGSSAKQLPLTPASTDIRQFRLTVAPLFSCQIATTFLTSGG